MFVFRKIWRAWFSCYLRFEIRPFALLPTNKRKPERFSTVLGGREMDHWPEMGK